MDFEHGCIFNLVDILGLQLSSLIKPKLSIRIADANTKNRSWGREKTTSESQGNTSEDVFAARCQGTGDIPDTE